MKKIIFFTTSLFLLAIGLSLTYYTLTAVDPKSISLTYKEKRIESQIFEIYKNIIKEQNKIEEEKKRIASEQIGKAILDENNKKEKAAKLFQNYEKNIRRGQFLSAYKIEKSINQQYGDLHNLCGYLGEDNTIKDEIYLVVYNVCSNCKNGECPHCKNGICEKCNGAGVYKKNISIPQTGTSNRREYCPYCRGAGKIKGEKINQNSSNGTTKRSMSGYDTSEYKYIRCNRCNGAGIITSSRIYSYVEEKQQICSCSVCNGSGKCTICHGSNICNKCSGKEIILNYKFKIDKSWLVNPYFKIIIIDEDTNKIKKYTDSRKGIESAGREIDVPLDNAEIVIICSPENYSMSRELFKTNSQ